MIMDYPIMLELDVSTSGAYELDVGLDDYGLDLESAIVINQYNADPYTGDYTVIPRRENIVLPTRNKAMTDDVTVLEIPYVAVSNPSGGKTYTIGG